MKTTIDIPVEIMEEVKNYSKASSKKEAVLVAMRDYIERRKMTELASRLGKLEGIISHKELRKMRNKP